MRRRLYSILLAAALSGGGLASCANSARGARGASDPAPVADTAAVQAAGLTAGRAGEARKLYTAKCIRCHKAYDPRAYTDTQWTAWMSKMSGKAHLDSAQRELLSRYLEAVRTSPAPTKSGDKVAGNR